MKLNTAIDYVNLGQQLIQEKKIDEAINCYQQAIHLQPDNFWYYNSLAELFRTQNKIETAIKYYHKVIELNSKFDNAYLKLGDLYQEKQQWEQATKYYLQAIKINPQNFWSFFNLGEIAAKQKKFDSAISYYQSGLKIQPHHYLSYCKLGVIYRQQTQYQKAIESYQKAITIAPHDNTAYFALQYIPVDSTTLNSLIQFYEKLAKEYPNISLLWGNLGDLFTKQDNKEQALICYRKSCYYNTISHYSHLKNLEWPESKQKGPDFIIIGAAKSGTSSLFMYLGEHPQIITPHKKELDFFNQNYNKGIDWYLSHFPSITDFPEFVTGEASPAYFGDPSAMKRISKHFPHTKLIALLRNPVDRAISWHYQNVKCGYEKRSLEEVIQEEIIKFNHLQQKGKIQGWGHIIDGIYIEKLKQWFSFISQEKFLILKAEDLLNDTNTTMQKTFQFLELPHHNSEKYLKYNTGSYVLDDSDLKQKLKTIFRPYNEQLEEYMNLKLNW